jgi:hypothetical protein
MIWGVLKESALLTDSVMLLGLALAIAGCITLGSPWANKWANKSSGNPPHLDPGPSIILTIISTLIVLVTAMWAYAASNSIWTAVSAGALGGLVHEIAQSKATAFLPDSAGSSASPATTGEESYLGGLMGIILGGAAGLLTLAVSSTSSTTSTTSTVSVQSVVTAFAAGIALKGVADAAASPPKPSS